MVISDDTQLTSLPFQLIEFGDEVIIRRGDVQVFVKGESSLETVLLILTMTSGKSASQSEILSSFSAIRHSDILGLLDELLGKRILIPTKEQSVDPDLESPEDIYFWQNNSSKKELQQLVSNQPIWLTGNNLLSHGIANGLSNCGINIQGIIDDPILNTPDITDSDCYKIYTQEEFYKLALTDITIIGCSPFGGQALLLEWNKWCVKYRNYFLPVLIEGRFGLAGPMVIPHVGPCLNCLRQRQNAHHQDHHLHRHFERSAHTGQSISAVHPTMISVMSDLVSMQIVRFYSKINQGFYKRLLKFDFGEMTLSNSNILKVPRCNVCSNFNQTSEASPIKLSGASD